MLKHAAKPGGLGLGGVLLIGGTLYFTHAGTWLMEHVRELESQCVQSLNQVRPSIRDTLCGGIGKGVDGIEHLTARVKQGLDDGVDQLEQKASTSLDYQRIRSVGLAWENQLEPLLSSDTTLTQMMQSGPARSIRANVELQLQDAMDSFAISQRYLGDASTMGQAMAWLQHGAQQPQGFGVMSQLQLAELYKTGGNGIKPDPLQAQAYYRLANSSLQQLTQSNSAQSQQLLQALPMAPNAMRAQIRASLAQLKKNN